METLGNRKEKRTGRTPVEEEEERQEADDMLKGEYRRDTEHIMKEGGEEKMQFVMEQDTGEEKRDRAVSGIKA
ncbi:hypothetical protein NDU88_003144 [Pleurodeles waltl]|uniref:Uncharacterized protein n=1 Tax=Pleurodeles waltl TaxID=8319 RepID=A0AAV7QBZ1_PLEWA|nr:hypothetical protein NDU88_003144 [Pleurodeles waltl]